MNGRRERNGEKQEGKIYTENSQRKIKEFTERHAERPRDREAETQRYKTSTLFIYLV